jgi:peptidoglycan/xylan/chitin deacetylase (PgdA/CDA1 family)
MDADNCVVALPILAVWPACTLFVTTGFMNGGRMFNDTVIEAIDGSTYRSSTSRRRISALNGSVAEKRATIDAILNATCLKANGTTWCTRFKRRAALPDDLMMSDDQLRRLRDAGMEIGAHTRTHPILANCSPSVAETEIANDATIYLRCWGNGLGFSPIRTESRDGTTVRPTSTSSREWDSMPPYRLPGAPRAALTTRSNSRVLRRGRGGGCHSGCDWRRTSC